MISFKLEKSIYNLKSKKINVADYFSENLFAYLLVQEIIFHKHKKYFGAF